MKNVAGQRCLAASTHVMDTIPMDTLRTAIFVTWRILCFAHYASLHILQSVNLAIKRYALNLVLAPIAFDDSAPHVVQ